MPSLADTCITDTWADRADRTKAIWAQPLRLARVLLWAAAQARAFELEQVREPVLAWELEQARPLVAAQVLVWVQRPSVLPVLSEPLELWVQAALWADLALLAA